MKRYRPRKPKFSDHELKIQKLNRIVSDLETKRFVEQMHDENETKQLMAHCQLAGWLIEAVCTRLTDYVQLSERTGGFFSPLELRAIAIRGRLISLSQFVALCAALQPIAADIDLPFPPIEIWRPTSRAR